MGEVRAFWSRLSSSPALNNSCPSILISRRLHSFATTHYQRGSDESINIRQSFALPTFPPRHVASFLIKRRPLIGHHPSYSSTHRPRCPLRSNSSNLPLRLLLKPRVQQSVLMTTFHANGTSAVSDARLQRLSLYVFPRLRLN